MKKINRKWRHGKHFVLYLLGIGVIVTLSRLLLFSADSSQKPEWKGTMKTENGVVIVENPAEPLYKNAALILTEELSIGGKDAVGDSGLLQVISYDIDSTGNIYVLDIKSKEIKKFDVTGRFIRKFGTSGQGPGEFLFPSFMKVVTDHELIVWDSRACNYITFSLDGEFQKFSHKSNMLGIRFKNIDKRGFITGFHVYPPTVSGETLVRVNSQSEKEEILFRDGNEWFIEKKVDLLRPEILVDATDDGRIVWAYPSQYVLHVVNSDGKMAKKITRKGRPIKISEEAKKKLEKQEKYWIDNGYKPYILVDFPYFNDISIDESGRIIVSTYEKSKDLKEIYCDVFDADGRYIAKILLPLRIEKLVWEKGKLYGELHDDEGYPVIKRYAVRWTFGS